MGNTCTNRASPARDSGEDVPLPTRPSQPRPAAAARPIAAAPPRVTHPAVSTTPMTSSEMAALTQAISSDSALNAKSYAFIGGLAVRLMGSTRATADGDLFVNNSTTAHNVAAILQRNDRFGVDTTNRVPRVYFKASGNKAYNVDIIHPGQPEIKVPFGEVVMIGGHRVLKPALLLESKCRSYLSRGDKTAKRITDGEDIIVILRWMKANGHAATKAEVPSANASFISSFEKGHPASKGLFRYIGL